MTLQRTFSCSRDVQLVQSGTRNGGVGKGQALSVGQLPSGSKTRTQLAFELDWSGVVVLSKAEVVLKVSDRCAAPGASPRFWVEKMTATFKEGDFADTCGVGETNAEVWPGAGEANHTTTSRAEYAGTPSNGDVLRIDVTAMLAASLAANETKLSVRLVASDGAGGYAESTGSRFVGFHSTERGNDGVGLKPRIEIQALEHHLPNVVSDVTPVTFGIDGTGPSAARVDRTFTVRGRFSCADRGDWLAASHVQFYPKGSTDDVNGNILTGAELHTLDGAGVDSTYPRGALLVSQRISAPDARVGLEMLGRVRQRCGHGLWSRWTRLSAMRIVPNSKPDAPRGLGVDTGSPTPDMTGRHVDQDRGSTVSWVETQIVRESAGGVEMLMNRTSHQAGDPDSGPYVTDPNAGGPQTVPAGGTLWRIPFDGTRPLRAGERVKRRHRTADQYHAVGDWCAWASWVVGEAAVPTFIPDPATKRDDLTPLLGASYPEAISALGVEVYAEKDLASLRLWASGWIAASGSQKLVEYGSVGKAKPLAWGQQPWGRAKVRVVSTGDASPWTELQPILLNSLPLAPLVSVDLAQLDQDVWRVPTLTPRLRAPFRDPDAPNDAATKQIVQVWRAPAGGTPLYQATVTSAIESFADIPASAGLVFEKPYVASVRHADTSGELGPPGSFAFTTHRPPTLALGAAPVAADPTPTIRWTATFYGTSQRSYRVTLYDVTNDVSLLDSGEIEDAAATSYVVPRYTFPAGSTSIIEARVYVTDTLGVTALLVGQSSVNSAAAASSVSSTALVPSTGTAPAAATPADTFTRGALVDTFGTSSSGHTYQYMGSAVDYDTNGTQGTLNLAAGGVARRAHFENVRLYAITAEAMWKTDKLAVGGALAGGVNIRAVDLANHLRVELVANTDATMDLVIVRVVDGVRTGLARWRTALTHVAGSFYHVKMRTSLPPGTAPPGTVLDAKAWLDGSGEPGYQVSAFDQTALANRAGSVGVNARATSGITNAPVLFTFDAIATTSP